MTLTITGIPQLRARLQAIKGSPKDYTKQWQIKTVAEAKRQFAPHTKTGATVRSIRPGSLSASRAEVLAGFGAPFVETGTRPHDIVPVKAKALAWPPKGTGRLSGRPRKGGAVIFAKRVHHPGTKADPFMLRAATKILRAIGLGPVVEDWNKGA